MLNGALLGAGNIARNGHLPAYLGAPGVRSRMRVTAVADVCPQNLAAIAELLPDARLYADAGVLLANERPDFVDICAPPYAHRQMIENALESGCHVICEKPVATDLADARAIRRRFESTPRVIFPCHQYHYAPQWLVMRQAIEANEVGSVTKAIVRVNRTGANPGNAAWNPNWRTDRHLAGGGILVDHGTHLFYQALSVFGPPRRIACRTERRLSGCGVDDTASISLLYPNREIRVFLTWAAQARSSSHRYIGTRGELLCLDDRVTVRSGQSERVVPFPAGLSAGSAHSDWFAPLLADFAERVERHDYRLDRMDEAVDVAACITLAYASAARDGEPLDWIGGVASHDWDAIAAG